MTARCGHPACHGRSSMPSTKSSMPTAAGASPPDRRGTAADRQTITRRQGLRRPAQALDRRTHLRFNNKFPDNSEEMMAERCRGRSHDHLAVDSALRPLLEKEVRWYQGYTGGPWRVDETCSRVTESGSGCFGWRFLLSEAATSNAASVIDEERDPVHRHPRNLD